MSELRLDDPCLAFHRRSVYRCEQFTSRRVTGADLREQAQRLGQARVDRGRGQQEHQEGGVHGATVAQLPLGRLSRLRAYRMMSVASWTIDGGIVSPSACAVIRLTTNSNLVGRSTGRSAGLAPFRILSTYVADRRYVSTMSTP